MGRLLSGIGFSFSFETLNMHATDTAGAWVSTLAFETLDEHATDTAGARVSP